ncbi:MAG TPA: HAD family phosphatase, partial [Roseiflexaceae bacterium]|nr:HAD family phosphatase [Roseiflexaceae bacterium]
PMTAARPFDIILFDLGGVLIELAGVDRMLELCNRAFSVDELWSRWLTSEGVRRFESGLSTPEEFGVAMLAEFGLPIEAAQFLEEFTVWPKAVFPGSLELLEQLSASFRLACLSNTNALHWPRVCDEMGLARYFEITFASHLVGMLKPDLAIFQHVVAQLDVPPERILFLDDNQLNVASAQAAGMIARRVAGLDEVRAALAELGVVPGASQQ